MDTDRIKAYNDQQTEIADYNREKADMAFAINLILKSQKDIKEAIEGPLVGVVKFLKDYQPQVNVTNPQELPDMKPVVASIEGLLTDFSKVSDGLNNVAKALQKEPPKPKDSIKVSNQFDYSPKFDELKQSFDNLKPAQIKVAAPQVNVEAPDLKPLTEAIESTNKPAYLDLSTYHAQDLDEQEQGMQYVGFTNLDGYWYILKNDMRDNTMRYKFGKDKYPNAWSLVSTFKYELLEGAINAIKT